MRIVAQLVSVNRATASHAALQAQKKPFEVALEARGKPGKLKSRPDENLTAKRLLVIREVGVEKSYVRP
jgi:hypothetical protein